MEALHAPWRIAYILAPKQAQDDASVFTQMAQSSDDEKNLLVARTKTAFACLNRYPYNGGHILVLPYRQVPDLDDLTDEELLDLMQLVRRCKQALTRLMKPDGFNVGLNLGKVAGAGIGEHLHFHIVPRWIGDTNFMPVLGGTTVLPLALEELCRNLRAILVS
jgi:ATP adenylyltransferase